MKFINLLKKELSEIITVQMIATMGVLIVVFMMMGNLMSGAIDSVVEDATNPKINICDLDDTELSDSLINGLKDAGAEITEISVNSDNYAAVLKENKIKNLIIIPDGFTESVENKEKPKLISVSKMESAATLANITNDNSGAASFINNCVTNIVAQQTGMSMEDIDLITNPIEVDENTVVADKTANISISTITAKLASQSSMLPIVLFVLIMLTSQSLITSVSNEKIDKTLETLLSAPVSRVSIITAKMLAAAIAALLNAVVMMVGFLVFMKDITNGVTEQLGEVVGETLSVDKALDVLGLNLSVGQYILVGIQFFVTMMICLSVSIILGSLVNDAKSAQTAILPITIIVMFPYVITLLTDVNALSTVPRILINAIPFTHSFTAMSNLMFGNVKMFAIGLGYQILVFAVCLFIALKLFKSDKILTLSLNFGKKKKKVQTED